MTFWHAFADSQQKIVYALPGFFGRNVNKLDLTQGSFRC